MNQWVLGFSYFSNTPKSPKYHPGPRLERMSCLDKAIIFWSNWLLSVARRCAPKPHWLAFCTRPKYVDMGGESWLEACNCRWNTISWTIKSQSAILHVNPGRVSSETSSSTQPNQLQIHQSATQHMPYLLAAVLGAGNRGGFPIHISNWHCVWGRVGRPSVGRPAAKCGAKNIPKVWLYRGLIHDKKLHRTAPAHSHSEIDCKKMLKHFLAGK